MEDFYMVKVIGLYKNSEKSATLNKSSFESILGR